MIQTSKQSGFALMTVLLMQLMIGIIAYAALDTAILGQNQTYASSESHLAYNGAEQRLLAGMRCIQSNHNNGMSVSDIMNTCSGNGLNMSAITGSEIRLTARDELDSGALRTINLLARPPLMSNFFNANGAYTCFGSSCVFEPPNSAASPGVDGTDRILSGQLYGDDSPLAQGCGNTGNSRPPTNSDGEDKAGAIVPNGTIGGNDKKNNKGSGGGGKPGQFEGDPPTVDSAEEYHDLYGEEGNLAQETLDKAKADLNDRIDALSSGADSIGGDVSIGDGETGLWVVKEGQTISLDGKTAGGTIILDGGTLELKGNECFAGIVVSRNNGKINASGTPAIVGAVLQIAGFTKDGSIEDAALNGNASVFYSSSTLEWARELANSMNSGDRWSFGNYRQVAN